METPIFDLRKIVAAHGNMDEAHVVGTHRSVEVDELRPVAGHLGLATCRDTMAYHEHQGFEEFEHGGMGFGNSEGLFSMIFWRWIFVERLTKN